MSAEVNISLSIVVFNLACLAVAAQDSRGNSQSPSAFPDALDPAEERSLQATPMRAPVRLGVVTPLGEALVLEEFRGDESLSSLFRFELELLAPNDEPVPFEAILGQDMVVTVELPGG